MTKYDVYATAVGEVYIGNVEAEGREDAYRKAQDLLNEKQKKQRSVSITEIISSIDLEEISEVVEADA
jgi:hypothetical protein